MRPVRIVIFAKAPLPGFAKTRLIPKLGQQGAASLAARLLKHAVEQAVIANVGPVELCVAPDMYHPIWKTLSLPDYSHWTEQGEGDLGERLSRSVQRVISDDESVILMGTDCPALNSKYLQMAAQSLTTCDASLIPVSDGGYALLGLNRYHPSLFSDIPWSTSEVARLTQQRFASLGWSLDVLSELNDIDEPDDLQWLPESML